MVVMGFFRRSWRLVNSTGTPKASPTQIPIKPDKIADFFILKSFYSNPNLDLKGNREKSKT
jgi:hypothetical protein